MYLVFLPGLEGRIPMTLHVAKYNPFSNHSARTAITIDDARFDVCATAAQDAYFNVRVFHLNRLLRALAMHCSYMHLL